MATKINEEDIIAEINVVPLVDIMLVVLIIFLLTAPLFIKPSINVDLPHAVSGENTTASKLNITLMVNGDIFLNGQRVSEQDLLDFTKQELVKTPNLQAIIAADENVAHGKVIFVIDLIKQLGVTKFAISIEKTP